MSNVSVREMDPRHHGSAACGDRGVFVRADPPRHLRHGRASTGGIGGDAAGGIGDRRRASDNCSVGDRRRNGGRYDDRRERRRRQRNCHRDRLRRRPATDERHRLARRRVRRHRRRRQHRAVGPRRSAGCGRCDRHTRAGHVQRRQLGADDVVAARGEVRASRHAADRDHCTGGRWPRCRNDVGRTVGRSPSR